MLQLRCPQSRPDASGDPLARAYQCVVEVAGLAGVLADALDDGRTPDLADDLLYVARCMTQATSNLCRAVHDYTPAALDRLARGADVPSVTSEGPAVPTVAPGGPAGPVGPAVAADDGAAVSAAGGATHGRGAGMLTSASQLLRTRAYLLIREIGDLARLVDRDGLAFLAWRMGQTTNDVCFAASDAGEAQRRRLAADRLPGAARCGASAGRGTVPRSAMVRASCRHATRITWPWAPRAAA